jgi:fused signal recognition particle receptor
MDQNLIIAISLFTVILAAVLFLVRRKKSTNVATPDFPAKTSLVGNANSEVLAEVIDSAKLLKPEDRALNLKDRLSKSQNSISDSFKKLFSKAELAESDWTDLEDVLVMADVGARTSGELINNLRSVIRKSSSGNAIDLKDLVKSELRKLVDGNFDRSLNVKRKNNQPAVVLTVGVNGTGKTTTTGKLARMLVAKDLDVLLGAADTFRAAAAEQLTTWADRIGVPVIRGQESSDPAAVAFDAVKAGLDMQVDVVLIDTAGRLHTKQGLMDELGKVHRIISKLMTVDEVLLVIDATTGQNGLNQAKVFAEVVPVSGVVLTKLDGTAKGGIVIAVQQELGIPVKLVGIGEGPDDLAEFDPKLFVDGLVN